MIPGLISRGRRWRMYYELYIDVFFLENLMMDSLILLALDHILKCGGKRGCIFLCAALGSLLTCAAVAAPLPGIAKLFLFHVCINSVMLITGLKIKSISQFVKAFILLYVVSVFMGGIMQIFRPYMRVVSLFYCAAFGCYLLLIRMWKLLSHEAERPGGDFIYVQRREKSKGAVGYRKQAEGFCYRCPCKYPGPGNPL